MEIAGSLGMKALGYDPYPDKDAVEKAGIIVVNLPGLLKQSDFITLHVPFNDSTRKKIGEDAFAAMKNGVSIINCSRGGVVDEEALCKNIISGMVKGAAFDVFEKNRRRMKTRF